MPNFKIFQDIPNQAKIQIYGSGTQPIQTDETGNLSVTGGVAINGTPTVTGSVSINGTPTVTGSVSINGTPTVTGSVSINGTPTITGSVSIDGTPTVTGSVSINGTPTVTGSVSINGTPTVTGSVSINGTPTVTGSVSINGTPTVTGSVSINGTPGVLTTVATTEAIQSDIVSNTTAYTAYPADPGFNVLNIPSWSFGIVNTSGVTSDFAKLQLQLSPDGNTWINDSSTTLGATASNVAAMLWSGRVLKYARIQYGNNTSTSNITLNIYFQGQFS